MVNALICARKNSKGLPGKNLKPLGGIPLVTRSINCAHEIPHIDKIIVSTDCTIIAEVAVKAGAEVPFLRPQELAEDTTPEWLVWRHAIEHFIQNMQKPIVVLPPTGPLRDMDDVSKAINLYHDTRCDIVITTTPAHRNPVFNMVKSNSDGTVCLAVEGGAQVQRRQDAHDYFDMTTNCYVANPTFVMTKGGLFDGRVRQVIVKPETAVDIDTQLDLDWAEFLLARRRCDS